MISRRHFRANDNKTFVRIIYKLGPSAHILIEKVIPKTSVIAVLIYKERWEMKGKILRLVGGVD